MTRALLVCCVVVTSLSCAGGEAALDGGSDAGELPEEERQDFPVVLGTGEGEFLSLDEGDPLILTRGFQGLQHVAASVRAWEIPEERYPVAVDLLRVSDGASVAEPASTRVPLLEAPGEEYVEIVGLRAVVEDPSDIVGQEARLRVTVEGPGGLTSVASHVGVVEWAPGEG